MLSFTRSRRTRAATAIFAALAIVLTSAVADARGGRGGSFGSRGLRTYEAPAPTQTAPRTAAPIERSASPATRPGVTQTAPRATAPARGFFGRGGFGSGLMGGLLGAGLIGLLFGAGFFSGLGSFAGLLGFALQILLIVFLARMAFRFFQNRARPAYAGAGPLPREAAAPRHGDVGGGTYAGAGSGGGKVTIGEADYQAFERLLDTVQTAYGREDLNALRQVATPEVVSYFAEELADNASRNVVNRVSDVRLLQGDLSEAWREGDTEYATVAMRFSLIDTVIDRDTGAVVEGDPDRPVEATEVWTFRRARGGRWLLSAIQQI